MVRTILKRSWILLVVSKTESLKSVSVLEKYLISLLGLEKSLKFSTLSMPDTFSVKSDYFAEENLAHPEPVKLTGNVKTFLCMNNICFSVYCKCYLLLYLRCNCKSYPVILQSCCRELVLNNVINNYCWRSENRKWLHGMF